ncbi:unnamed protein product [Schistosoma turkestanicum]|nr:unnamed protein product [Schistosoma turkestanicum]
MMMSVYISIYALILCTILGAPLYDPPALSNSIQSRPEDKGLNLSILCGKDYVLKTINSVPLYRIVSHFTNFTEEKESKVHDLNIPYSMYYTHIYFAWKSADQLISCITLKANSLKSRLNGANLVLPLSNLNDMYAPGLITSVLDFVTKCYEWAKPHSRSISSGSAFISTLRVAATNEINRALITYSTEQFLRATTHGSYHFVWEKNTQMRQFMKELNYEQVACGGNRSSSNPCDWTLMGLEPEKAKEQCLYRIKSENEKPYQLCRKMKILYWLIAFNCLQNVLFIACEQQDRLFIFPLQSIISYKAVEFLTNKSYEMEKKVNFLPLPYASYYTHLYMAFKAASKKLSLVSLIDNKTESNVNGANLVLPLKKLEDMYAPNPISNVLDFVRACYRKVAGDKINNTYISTMRYANTEKINEEIIKFTQRQFKDLTPKGSLHLLWEKKSQSDQLLRSFDYNSVACGNSDDQDGLCDWKNIGMPQQDASDQCLYKLENTN